MYANANVCVCICILLIFEIIKLLRGGRFEFFVGLPLASHVLVAIF